MPCTTIINTKFVPPYAKQWLSYIHAYIHTIVCLSVRKYMYIHTTHTHTPTHTHIHTYIHVCTFVASVHEDTVLLDANTENKYNPSLRVTKRFELLFFALRVQEVCVPFPRKVTWVTYCVWPHAALSYLTQTVTSSYFLRWPSRRKKYYVRSM